MIQAQATLSRQEDHPASPVDNYEYHAERAWSESPEYGIIEHMEKYSWEFMAEATEAFNRAAKLSDFDQVFLFRQLKRK